MLHSRVGTYWKGSLIPFCQFEKIYVINVPARSDKLDAMKVTASLTGFDFDIIEGINGRDVPKKALSGVCIITRSLESSLLMVHFRSGKRTLALVAR